MHAVAVKVRVTLFSYTVETRALPDAGRSGVTAYSYSGSVSCSTLSQFMPELKSNTVMVANEDDGNTTVLFICVHP